MKRMRSRTRRRKHLFTDQFRALDIRQLYRDGCLGGEVSDPVTVTWSDAGRSSIGVVLDRTGILLEYSVLDGVEREEYSERIVIQRTKCHFGGTRPWWFCPSCGRRCAVLYGGRRFLCRHCHGLRYRSQNENKGERLLRKAERIRARLGGSGVVFDVFPPRPKGMHKKTYRRLRHEAEEAKTLGLTLALGAFGCRSRRAWY